MKIARFSPDGKLIATAASDGTGRLWDVQPRKLLPEILRHSGAVYSARFSPESLGEAEQLAYGDTNG